MSLTTQQQQQLANWIQTVADWQTLTDAQVASAYTPGFAPVPYPAFQTAVMQLAAWGSVRLAGANLASFSASPPLQAAILTAIDLFTNYRGATVDESLPAFQAAMAGLQQAEILTSQDAAAILALGQTWPVPGVTTIAASDVTAARAAIAQKAAQFALVQKVNGGMGAALALINAAINSNGTLPTATQLQAAFAAAVGN